MSAKQTYAKSLRIGARVTMIPSRDEVNDDFADVPAGEWWIVAPHPDTGRYWIEPYNQEARSWRKLRGEAGKNVHRHGRHLLPVVQEWK